MHPGVYAAHTPEKPAIVMAGSGAVTSYAELDRRANQAAQLFRKRGLRPGDHIALFMENHPRYYEVYWAATRSGLYLTTVNRYLTGDEAAFIVDDCGAKLLVASKTLAEAARSLLVDIPNCHDRLMVDGTEPGYESYEAAVDGCSDEALAERPRGGTMLYSSGTTGRPKGILRPLSGASIDDPDPASAFFQQLFGIDTETVYLSPAPLYHSAPLAFNAIVQASGGTSVIMERFDAVHALESIERHRCTHAQFVPTMFTRMLKLSEEERARYDTSSLRNAVHAAAPCPERVKQQMIDWWGPVLTEYYGGTEFNGLTFLNSEEWLAHRGSVGRAVFGSLHICDEEGKELPPRESGIVYFELPQMPFAYHNDPEKTRDAQHPKHPNWTALGDVGYLDEDGFLYLTDRKTFMIVSGGVNIYPAEIENILVTHPKVMDVAVFGVPNEEFGEEVKAVVQPVDGVEGSTALEDELLGFARQNLAAFKCPRSVDFDAELPRLPTGKLYKRLLRDRYWGVEGSRIV
ncbi:MAG: AMP-binding protein [Myxococcales bacterium]|nr:AMP-binding protein [Myxococcales bacterium]